MIIRKMVDGTPLTDAEKPYEYLLVPQIYLRHPWTGMDFSQAKDPAGIYCNNIQNEAVLVFQKSPAPASAYR